MMKIRQSKVDVNITVVLITIKSETLFIKKPLYRQLVALQP